MMWSRIKCSSLCSVDVTIGRFVMILGAGFSFKFKNFRLQGDGIQ